MDSCETTGSGAANKTQQYGFGLIVACMSGGNAVKAVGCCGTLEESIAGAASGSFERKMKQGGEGGDVLGLDDRVEGELGSEFAHEAFVGLRVGAAKIVVEVEDERHYSEGRSKFGNGAQQGDGVSAATYGEADALAGANQAMLAQILFERLQHRNIIADGCRMRTDEAGNAGVPALFGGPKLKWIVQVCVEMLSGGDGDKAGLYPEGDLYESGCGKG
jgi:hypothetical protein